MTEYISVEPLSGTDEHLSLERVVDNVTKVLENYIPCWRDKRKIPLMDVCLALPGDITFSGDADEYEKIVYGRAQALLREYGFSYKHEGSYWTHTEN